MSRDPGLKAGCGQLLCRAERGARILLDEHDCHTSRLESRYRLKCIGCDARREADTWFVKQELTRLGRAYRTESAAKITLRKAQPGAETFRGALRDGLEQTRDLPTTTLHFAFSETNHSGLDQRSPVLALVKGGQWTLTDWRAARSGDVSIG